MERKREKERQIQLLKEAVEKEAAVKAKLLREQEMLETAKKASKTKKRKRKRDKPASSSESEFGASPISEEEASSDTNGIFQSIHRIPGSHQNKFRCSRSQVGR